jgi:hypothetical protein
VGDPQLEQAGEHEVQVSLIDCHAEVDDAVSGVSPDGRQRHQFHLGAMDASRISVQEGCCAR